MNVIKCGINWYFYEWLQHLQLRAQCCQNPDVSEIPGFNWSICCWNPEKFLMLLVLKLICWSWFVDSILYFARIYHLVMTNSSPWKITMLLIGKPSISMDHLYHGYVSHNQRVYPINIPLNHHKISHEYPIIYKYPMNIPLITRGYKILYVESPESHVSKTVHFRCQDRLPGRPRRAAGGRREVCGRGVECHLDGQWILMDPGNSWQFLWDYMGLYGIYMGLYGIYRGCSKP